ncbi:MAG: efflux RND transporter periplasmic adaptor subunit [Deltaproteobacteria bacterium]|nr:efflux RND transporter periplasmic adaptor subunit [Deltaproteobacteria bacterium]
MRIMTKASLASSVLLISLVLLASCGKKEQAAENLPPRVPVLKIEPRDISIPMEFVGQTRGAIDAEIRARVEGVIQSVNFKEGAEVKQGDLLYTIDPAPFEAKLAEAKAKLVEAQTKHVRAKSDLGRQKALAATKAASQRDLDAAIAQEGVAQGGVDAATAAVDAAQIELGYTRISAPVSGTIGLTKAKVGEFVGRPPNPVVLNTISQLDPIHVRFGVAEADYLYLSKLNQKRVENGEGRQNFDLTLVLADGSVAPDKGTLISLDSRVDPSTGTILVEASFPNPGKIIRPGQFARIRTIKESMAGVIVVPKMALRDLQGIQQIVVVSPENKAEIRNIKVGQTIGNQVVVTEGLSAGELIVPELQQRLTSGMTVVPTLETK